MRTLLLSTAIALTFTTLSAGAATWITDYDTALKTAAAQKKNVLVNFTGSDWCGWCKRLKAEVFDTPEFKKHADATLVLLEVDFPEYHKLPAAQAKANEKLRQIFKVEGFPTLYVINPQGQIINRLGYQPGGPQPFIAALDRQIVTEPTAPATPPSPAAKSQPAAAPVATVQRGPAPPMDKLVLKGITGSGARRIALINSRTFSAGETLVVPLAGKNVKVKCEKIEADHVLVLVEGESAPRKIDWVAGK